MQNRKKSQSVKKNEGSNIHISDEKILDLILTATEIEQRDILYFEKLIKNMDDCENKEIAVSMWHDDLKHKKILEDMYLSATGKSAVISDASYHISSSVKATTNQMLLNKLNSVEFYKSLYLVVKNQNVRDMVFDILVDEQSHAIRLNCLMSTL